MDHFGLLQGLGEIRVTFKADVADRRIEERFFTRFMGFMTFVARANRNWAVHKWLLEWFGVMTRKAKFGAIFTNFQQKLASATVGLVTRQAFTFLNRIMH
jgi:hypothetical protein